MVDMFPAEFLESLNISFDISLLYAANDSSENETLNDFSGLSDSDDVKYEKALFNHYLMGIGGTTVCFVGIICNILSVIVLTRRVMNSSTYSYLSALAVCDTIALTLTVTLFLLSTDIQFPKKGEIVWASDVYAYLFPYLHPSAMAMQVTSIWLTLGFTVDRYIMICHPFRAESMCNVKRARMVIVLIYVLGILFNIPRFLEYKSKTAMIPSLTGDLQKRVLITFTDIGENKLYIDLMHSYLYITFVCGIPFLTMSILNIFLMHAVHLSRQRGKQINIKEKKRNDTTIMLIGVIIIFLACQGPALISRMVYAINRRMATSSLTFHKINEVGNFLIIVNSAINIVPYYFFGKRFRREFWRLFCKCVLSGHELRKMTRSLSFSVEHRRKSVISNGSQYELNGFLQPGATGLVHRDSNSPLLQHIQHDHKDSMIPYLNTNHTDRTPSPCFSEGKNENGQAGQPLKVIWEMDDNKNEKYNVKVIEVGVTDVRYVTLEHARPWVIHAYRNIKGRGLHIEEELESESRPLPSPPKEADVEPVKTTRLHPNTQPQGDSDIKAAGERKRKFDAIDEALEVDESQIADGVKKPKLGTQSDEETASKTKEDVTKIANEHGDETGDKMAWGTHEHDGTVVSISDRIVIDDKTAVGADDDTAHEEVKDIRTRGLRKRKSIEPAPLATSRDPPPTSTYDKVRLIIQPWRKPEGGINKPVLKMMLESVMLFLMMKPGSGKRVLLERYSPYLQPMVLQNIVHILEELGCIRTQYITEKKCSLFSKPTLPDISSDVTEDSEPMYLPTEECVFRLGQFGREFFPHTKWPPMRS